MSLGVTGRGGAAGTSTRPAAWEQTASTAPTKAERVIAAASMPLSAIITVPGMASTKVRIVASSMFTGCQRTVKVPAPWVRCRWRSSGTTEPPATRFMANRPSWPIQRRLAPTRWSLAQPRSHPSAPEMGADRAAARRPSGSVRGEWALHSTAVAPRSCTADWSSATSVTVAVRPATHTTTRPGVHDACRRGSPLSSSGSTVPSRRRMARSRSSSSSSKSAFTSSRSGDGSPSACSNASSASSKRR